MTHQWLPYFLMMIPITYIPSLLAAKPVLMDWKQNTDIFLMSMPQLNDQYLQQIFLVMKLFPNVLLCVVYPDDGNICLPSSSGELWIGGIFLIKDFSTK